MTSRTTGGDAAVGLSLPGYVAVASPGAHWVVQPACVAEIARGDHDHLLTSAAPHRQAAGGGRGPLITLRLGGKAAIAKRPIHGGLLGRALGTLYWGRDRILDQVRAAHRLRTNSVATPDILAAGWRRVAGPLQRHTLIASAIPDAINLYEACRNPPPGMSRRAVLRDTAEAVRRMHDARFLHADLNVTNLVLEPRAEGYRVLVVDLDRGRFCARIEPGDRARNLARLLRSYEKWLAGIAPLSGREEVYFLRCYARADRAMTRSLWEFLRSYRRSLGARRLAWRTRPGRAAVPGMVDRAR